MTTRRVIEEVTAADLARIAAAIDADSATEAANWPMSRERARAYIGLGKAMLARCMAIDAYRDLDRSDRNGYMLATRKYDDAARAELAALAALAALADATGAEAQP